MTSRDDFMRVEIDPVYQKAGLYWFEIYCVIILVIAPENGYHRANVEWMLNSAPLYVYIGNFLGVIWIMFFPVFLTIIYKILKCIEEQHDNTIEPSKEDEA